MSVKLFFFAFLALSYSLAIADPRPLQDFCVADFKSNVVVNGFPCKNPSAVTADDFTFTGLLDPVTITSPVGVGGISAFINQFPGLNTLGVSISRVDFAPNGVFPLHVHPRSSEILLVVEGIIAVGFVSTNNVFYTKTLAKGDVFVVPQGLAHLAYNKGTTTASALAAFGSQNPGVWLIANSTFGSAPGIPSDILARNFRVDTATIDKIKANFGA